MGLQRKRPNVAQTPAEYRKVDVYFPDSSVAGWQNHPVDFEMRDWTTPAAAPLQSGTVTAQASDLPAYMTTVQIGDLGEQDVVAHLQAKGYTILANHQNNSRHG